MWTCPQGHANPARQRDQSATPEHGRLLDLGDSTSAAALTLVGADVASRASGRWSSRPWKQASGRWSETRSH